MELIMASSPLDAGISCWDLHTGAEQLRYRACTSPPHGLTLVANTFIASSQLRGVTSSGSICYWSWNKVQPEVKSFPAEPIGPLISNSEGEYIVGGGSSGDIYFWEVSSGCLLKKWRAHYRSVTCLLFSDDESFIISGAEDGFIRVWSICRLLDPMEATMGDHLYELSFSGHSLKVTDLVCGYGGSSAILISSSEDHSCKVWSIAREKLLRTVDFPSVVNALALDPKENVFYAGCGDGRVYIAALNAPTSSSSNHGPYIISSLFDHSGKTVNSLAISLDGKSLVSGCADGIIRIWDTKHCHVIRVMKHAKGPINNIVVIQRATKQNPCGKASSSKRQPLSSLAPPLKKYIDDMDEAVSLKHAKVWLTPTDQSYRGHYTNTHVMINQLMELEGSSMAAEMELERLKLVSKRSLAIADRWKEMCKELLSMDCPCPEVDNQIVRETPSSQSRND